MPPNLPTGMSALRGHQPFRDARPTSARPNSLLHIAGRFDQDGFALTPDTQIGPFQILSQLDHGGMGEVYLARDTRLDRKVAIKVLPPEFTRDENRLRRFDQESKTLAALNHPNLIEGLK